MHYLVWGTLFKLILFLRESRAMADSTNSSRRKRALVIGIGEYEEGRKLPNTVKDANDM